VWRQTVLVACLGLAVFGCSSTDLDEPPPTAMPSNAAERERVLGACTEFAARLCSDSAACCDQAFGGYDAESCARTLHDDVCRPGADAVASGFAQYDETAVEACLAAHAAANAICTPTWEQNLAIRKSLWKACKVLRGTTPAGKGCTTDITCAEPEGERTAACVAGTCRVLEILPQGAPCPFQSGTVSICDSDLYCTATLDTPGSCQPVIVSGSACSGILADPACGFGSYCDSVDKTCKKTTNLGGPSCKQGLECVSFDCDRTTELCAPAPAIVSAEQCLGATF